MAVMIWFFVRIIIGVVIAVVGLIGFCMLTFRGRTKTGATFIPLVLVGSWVVTGGTIEGGSYKVQAESFLQLAHLLSQPTSQPIDLDKVAEMNERGVAAWWKLLQYRIEIRSLLHKICKNEGCSIKNTDVGFEKLLSTVADLGLIDPKLRQDLDRIRVSTYYAEWRDGDAPDEEDVKFVLATAPGAIKQLQALSGTASGAPQ